MKKNLGNADRLIRILIAVVVAILFGTEIINGTLAYILLGAAGIFLITGFISFCPLYTIFGIKTCKEC